jgi:hypothetical protein
VLGDVPEQEWCTCGPRVKMAGREWPPAARFEIPGASWLGSLLGGGAKKEEVKKDEAKKQEL